MKSSFALSPGHIRSRAIRRAGITDQETYSALEIGVFEETDSVAPDLLARQRAKPAGR